MVAPLIILAIVAIGGLAVLGGTLSSNPQAQVKATAAATEKFGTPEQIKAAQATANSNSVNALGGLIQYSASGATGGSGKETSNLLEGTVSRTNPAVAAAATGGGLGGAASSAVQPTSQPGTNAGRNAATGTQTADSSNAISSMFGAMGNFNWNSLVMLLVIGVVLFLVIKVIMK